MSQEVLYRKWRPQRFADVAGQDPITTTLRHAVAGGTPSHAYLLTGPRGTGKTTTGRILAKAVNCAAPVEGEPCDACPSCDSFNAGRALDLIELDAASNRGIDEVRALREAAGYAPSSSRYKVYLIDEVHMLTDAAFNALLKTLEEPPPHIIFVLATTESHRIPATITSRCQRFDFRRITLPAVVARLAVIAAGEGITVAAGGLEAIARQATGSLRDAVNLLDQLVAYHGHTLDLEAVQQGLGLVVDHRTAELARAAVTSDLAAGLTILAGARDDGIEMRAFVREVVQTLRALLMLRAGAGEGLPLSEMQLATLRALANEVQSTQIVRALQALGSLDFAGDPYDSLPAEIAFASLAVGLTDATAASAPAPTPPPAGRPAAPAARGGQRGPAAPGAGQRGAPPTPPQPRQPASASASGQDGGREAPAPRPATEDRPPPSRTMVLPDEGEASPELAQVRSQWAAIRESARKRYFKAGPLLQQAQVKQVGGDRIEVGFQFRALLDKAQEDAKVMQAVREAVSEAVGRPVEVVPVVWEALQSASTPSTPSTPAAGSDSGSAAGASAVAAGRPAAPPAPPAVPAAPRPASGGGHLLEEALKLGALPVEE